MLTMEDEYESSAVLGAETGGGDESEGSRGAGDAEEKDD